MLAPSKAKENKKKTYEIESTLNTLTTKTDPKRKTKLDSLHSTSTNNLSLSKEKDKEKEKDKDSVNSKNNGKEVSQRESDLKAKRE
eukprot:CAMPEP_0116906390 /NCGR_PEP_ID=MMETSP0467-20121206/12499_1 /TAXON_ID=283647 /ORGANISM="Mesodinium pulex, Strain SPMC105" /LENGTH=85 /DNA_ID=CAMNT_0004581243 /DNA_START=143 /DNA_END=400 /DNA_ORIENTATION=+